jgi:hypothetical protein
MRQVHTSKFGIVPAAAAMAVLLLSTARTAVADTLLDMPPPPGPARTLPSMNVETAADVSDVVTMRERVAAAALDGPQRSLLGEVALTRYRRARSTSYNRYINFPNRFPGYRINYGFQNHYPFDVSFLHGVPTHCGGYDWPWVGFGTHIRFFGTW